MGFLGKIPRTHPNARTEFAWMISIQADHIPLSEYKQVKGYDYVVCILPKGAPMVDCQGVKIEKPYNRPRLLEVVPPDFASTLKDNNGRLCYMQEGPTWFPDNYDMFDQIVHFNFIRECDLVFCHNEYDKKYYSGFVNSECCVHVMPTLLIEDLTKHIKPDPQDKVMIGGNFSRWYGGFQSYLIAAGLGLPMYVPSSHSKREGEDQMNNLTHLPYAQWNEWMKTLSTFKFAVHLMPTIAAGTFSLNCAYFGIPCIGNKFVDTQNICFRNLSVDVNDLQQCMETVDQLNDPEIAEYIGNKAKDRYHKNFSEDVYLKKMEKIFV